MCKRQNFPAFHAVHAKTGCSCNPRALRSRKDLRLGQHSSTFLCRPCDVSDKGSRSLVACIEQKQLFLSCCCHPWAQIRGVVLGAPHCVLCAVCCVVRPPMGPSTCLWLCWARCAWGSSRHSMGQSCACSPARPGTVPCPALRALIDRGIL